MRWKNIANSNFTFLEAVFVCKNEFMNLISQSIIFGNNGNFCQYIGIQPDKHGQSFFFISFLLPCLVLIVHSVQVTLSKRLWVQIVFTIVVPIQRDPCIRYGSKNLIQFSVYSWKKLWRKYFFNSYPGNFFQVWVKYNLSFIHTFRLHLLLPFQHFRVHINVLIGGVLEMNNIEMNTRQTTYASICLDYWLYKLTHLKSKGS